MQFQIVTILSVAALASASNITTTYTNEFTTIVETITSCGPEVTNCPYRNHSNNTNVTIPPVTSWEGAANGFYAKAGVAAVAGVAAFLL